ncbi:MAG: hypothetical protein A4E42_02184 [Methanoregulaceae archaeon PtaU1.Bin222]|nr:MAG: hypothetical protein A4E42_02184 [Methanoregulaceae archaeon PtaU1.Bin222]
MNMRIYEAGDYSLAFQITGFSAPVRVSKADNAAVCHCKVGLNPCAREWIKEACTGKHNI